MISQIETSFTLYKLSCLSDRSINFCNFSVHKFLEKGIILSSKIINTLVQENLSEEDRIVISFNLTFKKLA